VTASATVPAPSGFARWSPRAWFRRWWQSRLPRTDTWQLGQRLGRFFAPTGAQRFLPQG
jgi:hypothetical protein